MTGCTVIWASGLGAPVPDLGGGDRPRCFLEPGESAGAEDGGVFEVDVQHHLALRARSLVLAGDQVESQLCAGEVAGRDGAAYVQGLGRPEEELLVGVVGQRGVEVDRVGQVQLALDVHGAGGADLGQVHVGVPAVRGRPSLGLGLLGVEPGFGLIDEPLELGGADLVRHRRDVGVHERRRFRRQHLGAVGDGTELPRRQLPCFQAGPATL
jgi:hypothetical protein